MGSPFPGMDPYIEACHLWEDFHSDLIGEIKRSLANQLPKRYVIRAGERSYVALTCSEDEEDKRTFLPDVAIASRQKSSKATRKSKTSESGLAVQRAPGSVIMRALIKDEYREPFLEIRQIDPERKLVTGIEVLSPSNKRPGTKGWRLYYRKRRAFLSGYANFVELDLLRRGRRMPMIDEWPDSPYYLLVSYKQRATSCWVSPAYFTDPLPPLTIPLAPPDPEISLDVQPLVDAIYARSRYEQDIDYRRPLYPPLTPPDQAWLEERLQEREKASN
jgi:hypothetical protein